MLLWVGALRLLTAIGGRNFDRAKAIAITGLSLGFLLYAVGFVCVGGEWFAMWQSNTWNGQEAAFRFYAALLGTGIFIALEDRDLNG